MNYNNQQQAHVGVPPPQGYPPADCPQSYPPPPQVYPPTGYPHGGAATQTQSGGHGGFWKGCVVPCYKIWALACRRTPAFE